MPEIPTDTAAVIPIAYGPPSTAIAHSATVTEGHRPGPFGNGITPLKGPVDKKVFGVMSGGPQWVGAQYDAVAIQSMNTDAQVLDNGVVRQLALQLYQAGQVELIRIERIHGIDYKITGLPLEFMGIAT